MKPSPTQRETLRRLQASASQRLERRPGGYWCLPETEPAGMVPPAWSITVQTVRAMEQRGWLVRDGRLDEWRDGRALTEAGRSLTLTPAGEAT